MMKSGAGPVCKDQVTGMRTTSNPAWATAWSNSAFTCGLPHSVSPSGASRLLPKFHPRSQLSTSCIAVPPPAALPPLPTGPPPLASDPPSLDCAPPVSPAPPLPWSPPAPALTPTPPEDDPPPVAPRSGACPSFVEQPPPNDKRVIEATGRNRLVFTGNGEGPLVEIRAELVLLVHRTSPIHARRPLFDHDFMVAPTECSTQPSPPLGVTLQ